MTRRAYFMGGLYYIGSFAVMYMLMLWFGLAEKYGLFSAFFAGMVGTVMGTAIQHEDSTPSERRNGAPVPFKFMLAASFGLLCFMCLMAVEMQGYAWFYMVQEVHVVVTQHGTEERPSKYLRNPLEFRLLAVGLCALLPVLLCGLFWNAMNKKHRHR